MYECVKLKFNNIKYLKLLYNTNIIFNNLNEDYFSIYDNSNILKKFLLMKDVTLLRDTHENIYIGYLWRKRIKSNFFKIKALNINNKYEGIVYNNFFVKYPKDSVFLYKCKKNNFNYVILSNIGFTKIKSTVKMLKYINKEISFLYPKDISFKKFIINKDEKLRCFLQNKIFYKETRLPLSINDIYVEEKQKYFYKDTCFFIHDNQKNISFGYGQIIFKNNYPTIVNFGLLKEYRGKGYGKCFLIHLLNYLYKLGYHKSYIEVAHNNIIALNLYKKLNFNIIDEVSEWKLKR